MQRYYAGNQTLRGLGDLISGAVQQRQQVHAQEAAARDRANMQIYGGMGQGLGNLASSYAGTQLNQQNRAADFANQVSLLDQRGQQALQFENQRSANDIHEQLLKTFYGAKSGGMGVGGAPFDVGGMPQEQGVGTNIDGSVMMPQQAEPPMQPVAPLPAQNPMYMSAYKNAEQAAFESAGVIQRAELDKNLSVQDRNAIMMKELPNFLQAQRAMARYPQQKPPTTFEEMAQAGVHGGGITVAPDGSWLVPKGMTRAMPPKTQPDQVPIPSTPGEAQQYAANRYAKLDDGTKVLIQPDGKLTPVKDADDDEDLDYSKEYDAARKSLEAERDAIIKNIPPGSKTIPKPSPVTNDAIMKRMQEKEDALKIRQLQPKFEAINRRADELLNGIMMQEMTKSDVDQWMKNVIDTFGSDTTRWPKGLENTYRHVLENARDLYQNQLMVVP